MSYIFPGYNGNLEEMHTTEEDYKFGAISKLPQEVLCPDRQWTPSKFEPQSNSVLDTFNCTGYGITNPVEMIHIVRYKEEPNFSDRFVAVTSGTVPGQGNSHKNVAEAVRKCGLVPEEKYPFSELMTQEEYFTQAPKEVLDLGLEWVVKDEFGYEKFDIKDLWDILPLSPGQIAVDSRANKTSEFRQYDHSIDIVGGIYKKEVYTTDNYLGRNQTYDWDYPFGFPQRYHYKKLETLIVKEEQFKNNQFLVNFINWLKLKGVIVVTT